MEKQKNQYANGRKVRKLKDFSDGPASARHIKHILSLVCGVLIWWLLSLMPGVGVILAGPQDIIRKALPELLNDGSSGEFERFLLVKHIRWSFQRVLLGWAIAFAAAIPTAFLMGWYRTFRDIVDPWIQFLRTIPPIALIPMVILLMGTGEKAKITVIFITAFLVMTVTIYQGIRNLDYTLVKAAYTFGANDFSIFVRVVVPYTFPYILTAARLGGFYSAHHADRGRNDRYLLWPGQHDPDSPDLFPNGQSHAWHHLHRHYRIYS